MKKIYALFTALLILSSTYAATHIINVSNYQFSPATVYAVVGDTIKWVWNEGFHTSTSVNVPAGADPWNAPLETAGATFSYKLTVAGTYNYQCNFHAAFGMTGTINASGVLPVILSSFNIAAGKANTTSIIWSTATEQNTDHFEVMRSTNGKTFTKIATVPAAGNSSLIHNYSYTDADVSSDFKFIYYSLTIVDKDGSEASSAIEMYTNNNGKHKLIVSLGPNPVGNPAHLMLQFNADKEGSMHVQLFNAAGKLVKEDDLSATEGLNNGHFHIGDVEKGIYTVVFSMDDKKESYKIAVQ